MRCDLAANPSVHCDRRRTGRTDWPAIRHLYRGWPAAEAHRRLGRDADAADHYRSAIGLGESPAIRGRLLRRSRLGKQVASDELLIERRTAEVSRRRNVYPNE